MHLEVSCAVAAVGDLRDHQLVEIGGDCMSVDERLRHPAHGVVDRGGRVRDKLALDDSGDLRDVAFV
jgi:hypothetical protein